MKPSLKPLAFLFVLLVGVMIKVEVEAVALIGGPQHFTVAASFVPPVKAGANGTLAVSFTANDPDVHINQEPAPRIKLDPSQTALVDRQPPASPHIPAFDPDTAQYLDLGKPVLFPVAWAPRAKKGPQSVKAAVTYFYCSKREGWCRKGLTDVEVLVTVP